MLCVLNLHQAARQYSHYSGIHSGVLISEMNAKRNPHLYTREKGQRNVHAQLRECCIHVWLNPSAQCNSVLISTLDFSCLICMPTKTRGRMYKKPGYLHFSSVFFVKLNWFFHPPDWMSLLIIFVCIIYKCLTLHSIQRLRCFLSRQTWIVE